MVTAFLILSKNLFCLLFSFIFFFLERETMAIWVVEGYKIRLVLGQKSLSSKEIIVFCELLIFDNKLERVFDL